MVDTGLVFRAAWPIIDDDLPISVLIAEAAGLIDDMAAEQGARLVHEVAWTVHGLREKGCQCRRLVGGNTTGAKRVTRSDHKMVYYSTDALSVTLIRGGHEHAITFAFESKEAEADFIYFIAELMCDAAEV